MKINVTPTRLPAILLLIFFFSGFAGLMYELVWIRILSLVFGKTTEAVTIVVAVYMAGLGLGSIFWGNRIDRKSNHLKTFSILQWGIGISSAVILVIFHFLPGIYKFIYSVSHATPTTAMVLMFFASFICMLVPTFMMGGTLPVISKCFIKNNRNIGSGIGLLYAVNTLGGILGAGLTGYFFIGMIGQIQTQVLAISINLILGGFAFLLIPNEQNEQVEQVEKEDLPYPKRVITLSLFVAGLSGFCGLAFEILSSRAVGIFVTNSTYTFTCILIVFLSGISVGSFIFTRFLSTQKQLLFPLALCQAAIGFYIIVIGAFLNDIPTLVFPFEKNILQIPLIKIVFPGLFLSSVLLLVPSILMGISFPIVCRIYTSSVHDIGKRIGKIYFVNTLGSIIGPLIAGFALIPLFGVSKGMVLIAYISIITGTVLLLLDPFLKRKKIFAWGMGGCIMVSILFTMRGFSHSTIHPPSFFRTQSMADTLLYYKETTAGTVFVRKDKRTGGLSLYVNNNSACGVTYDALTVVKVLGHLPFIINSHSKDVLIIGFGAGVTTSAVAKHKVRSIDCIEICPGVKEAAKFFSAYNNNILSHPKVSFIPGDGRNHLLLTDKKYDVISCDPIHPTLGSGNLYTREYFELCKNHLNRNGIVSQYLPLHKLSLPEFKSLIKTFRTVFPHNSVWLAHSHCVLLGSFDPVKIDFRYLAGYLTHLNDGILNDPYRMAISLFLDNRAIDTFTKDAIIHTDNRPFLEFFTPITIKKENWHNNLEEMMKYRIDPSVLFSHIENQELMARYLIAQELFLEGLIHKNKGEMSKVIKLFGSALEINPENSEIKLFFDNEVQQYQRRSKAGRKK